MKTTMIYSSFGIAFLLGLASASPITLGAPALLKRTADNDIAPFVNLAARHDGSADVPADEECDTYDDNDDTDDEECDSDYDDDESEECETEDNATESLFAHSHFFSHLVHSLHLNSSR